MISKLVLIAVLSLAAFAPVYGQRGPSFSKYPARVERLRNITVDLKSHKTAGMFRTNLRNAAKHGVNFAGHYVLVGWGCGTNCSEWAIIDGRNGKVYFPGELAGVGFGFCDLPEKALPRDTPRLGDDAAGPLYSKASSRLLVLTGYKGGELEKPKSRCGDYFFEWTGTRLRQISVVPGQRIDTP